MVCGYCYCCCYCCVCLVVADAEYYLTCFEAAAHFVRQLNVNNISSIDRNESENENAPVTADIVSTANTAGVGPVDEIVTPTVSPITVGQSENDPLAVELKYNDEAALKRLGRYC